jgi:hypothetical protein
MDLSKFKTSDWLKIGGAVGMLIFGLFAWVSGAGASGNAFDFFFTGTIPWLLIVGVGVISLLLVMGTMKRDGLMWDAILLIAAALGALLVVIRLIIGPKIESGGFEFEFDRGVGLFLSAISCVVCAVGAYLGFTEQGGNIAQIGDAFKKTGSGRTGSGMTPPPPPPSGMTPPPPPPPPVG